MRVKINNFFFLIVMIFLISNFQVDAYLPSSVEFHETIQTGEVFNWEFTTYNAFDIHNPDLSTEYGKGDIINTKIISEPVFSISMVLIPQPLKEDEWVEYSLNETMIDISAGGAAFQQFFFLCFLLI